MVEQEMKASLAKLLAESVAYSNKLFSQEIGSEFEAKYIEWIDMFQIQLVVLTAQIGWCQRIDTALMEMEKSENGSMDPLEDALKKVESILYVLADSVLKDQPSLRRKKLEHLVSKLWRNFGLYLWAELSMI